MKIDKRYKIIILLLIFLSAGSFIFFLKIQALFRPNILLINIDSLRSDHLSCYGYKRNTSPNIDKLAKEGVLFTQAIGQATYTWPSVHSLMMSAYPSTHKIRFRDQLLFNTTLSLPHILNNNGYKTALITSHPELVSQKNGLGKDFDTFLIRESNAAELTEKIKLWLNNSLNKKFFLWIHYMDTHETFLGIPEDKKFSQSFSPEEIENYIARYDAAISYIDRQIFTLIQELKKLGLYKNTLIVIAADHGEELGEHSIYFCHSGPVWDSLIKVPLIFHYPNMLATDRLISAQVQLIDIAPTICGILGIRKPKTFEGKSFLSLLRRGKTTHSLYAFSEHIHVEDFLISSEPLWSQFSVRTTDWKLIFTLYKKNKKYQLYNLKIDPRELNNLVETEKEQFKILKTKLEEWINRPKPNITPLVKPLDEGTKERLKSLGYLQ